MIVGAAFCPHPPMLVPDIAGAAAAELADLRASCVDVISQLVGLGSPLVLIGSGSDSAAHAPSCRGTMAGFGLPLEVQLGAPGRGGSLDLPLSLTVGGWLVRDAVGPRPDAGGFSVGPDFAGHRAAAQLLALAEEQDIALLVMGDGSARRSTTAPGYLDERAAAFDAAVASALSSADAAALLALDASLGAELLAAGVPAWHAAGRLLEGGAYAGTPRYENAPYGVGYFVAQWLPRG